MTKVMRFLPIIILLGQTIIVHSAFAEKSGSAKVNAAGNFTVGLGPIGNFYMTKRRPDLSPGVGALIYFDYRWSPELSTTASVMMLVQNGTGLDGGETNVVFLGLPTLDVKYYFITNPSRWDPYAGGGIGYYAVTAGSRGRGVASGLGAQVGAGTDYYLTSKMSLGLAAYFRSIGLLSSGSTGSFPISLLGNFGFHF